MSIEDIIAVNIPIWRTWVEENGGNYVGVQMPIFCDGGADDGPQIMFTRANSTQLLSLPVEGLTQDMIINKLGRKVTKFQQIELVNFTRLGELVARLRGTLDAAEVFAAQIEEELKNAEK